MITISNLKKTFDTIEALKGISFNIPQGECYGLLGPNGAGKTTTISIMSTVIEPNEGEVNIAGYDLKKNPQECKKNIGVVTQEIALYSELSAYDNLLFWGGLYNVPKPELIARIDETMNLLGLSDRKNDKVRTYSGGMKRRINFASALLHRPNILLMDEPTVGIDPQSRNLIFEVVEKLHKEGMTIVYTTHYMEEAERLCDRIGIIDNGEIIAQGTLDELKASGSMKENVVISYTNLTDERYTAIETEWNDLQRFEDSIHFYFGNMGDSEESKLGGLVHVVSGTSVMMLLFSVAGIGGSLLDEKQEGMLKKLLCSPMPPNHILYGKLVFANIISIVQLIIMFVYAWLVFGLDILHYLPAIVLMILAIAYACSGFGIVLASFAKSRQQVQGLSTIIVLVMSAMGGSMIPIFIMPEIMQKIAVVSVNYWGIKGFYDIFLNLLPITDITFLSKVFVLIGIGTLLNFIALLMFKKNILKIV